MIYITMHAVTKESSGDKNVGYTMVLGLIIGDGGVDCSIHGTVSREVGIPAVACSRAQW